MASLTGVTGGLRRSRLWSNGLVPMLGLLGATISGHASLPDYLREALAGFRAEPPAQWAYTITTIRNEVSTSERYDPAQPPGERWALLFYNDRRPTGRQLEKYRKLRSANPQPASQASFQHSDIDPGSLRLLSEDNERAEFLGGFREVAAGADKMLRHLELHLTVNKRVPHVEKYALSLREPYSPILGVRMNELRVEMSFHPPAPGRPSLPAAYHSLFTGRIFFIRTREDLRVTYKDFVPAAETPVHRGPNDV